MGIPATVLLAHRLAIARQIPRNLHEFNSTVSVSHSLEDEELKGVELYWSQNIHAARSLDCSFLEVTMFVDLISSRCKCIMSV